MDPGRFQGPVPAHLLPAERRRTAPSLPPAPAKPKPPAPATAPEPRLPAITFVAPSEPEPAAPSSPIASRNDLAARARALADEGVTVGAIAVALEISHRRVARMVEDSTGAGGLCACGREWRHVGACRGMPRTPAQETATAEIAAWTKTEQGREAARARARHMQARRTPEQRSVVARALHARRTPEEESAVARRAAQTRVWRQEQAAAALETQVQRAGRKVRLEQRLGTGGFVCVYVAGGEAPLAEDEAQLLVRLGMLLRQFERRRKRG